MRTIEQPAAFRLLALSGSLRAASINSALCRAVARLAPPSLRVDVFEHLGELPLFNPDREGDPPAAVRALRSAVADADALLVASPEYAHGIAGPMKNALDWLVSFEGVVGKPVALVNASPRAHHAYDALREVLQTMSTRIVPEASVTLPLLGACITEDAMVESAEIRGGIAAMCDALVGHLGGTGTRGPSFPLG